MDPFGRESIILGIAAMACVRADVRPGLGTPGWVVGGVGTFVVSLVFAYHVPANAVPRVGPPFGLYARPWGIFVAVATALVSAGFGLLILAASHETSRRAGRARRARRALALPACPAARPAPVAG